MYFLQHHIAPDVLGSNRLFTTRHENGFLDVQIVAGQELFVLMRDSL
jgi:hypothetical protein